MESYLNFLENKFDQISKDTISFKALTEVLLLYDCI